MTNKAVHLAIDLQELEAATLVRYYSYRDLGTLTSTVQNLIFRMALNDVPTIYVALIQSSSLVPSLGSFRDIDRKVAEKTGESLRRGEYSFSLPVKEDSLVLVKKTYSACVAPLMDFLEKIK